MVYTFLCLFRLLCYLNMNFKLGPFLLQVCLQCCKIKVGQVLGCHLFEPQFTASISSITSLASGQLHSSLSYASKTSQDNFSNCETILLLISRSCIFIIYNPHIFVCSMWLHILSAKPTSSLNFSCMLGWLLGPL